MTPRTKPNTMTLRVSDELKDNLSQFAKLTGRSLSYVAATAVEEYLAWRVPQLEDLDRAIKDVDTGAGAFASKKDIDTVMKKWKYVRN